MIEIVENLSDNESLFENLFYSKGRAKIIRILALEGELNISKLITISGLNHSIVISHLDILKSCDLVEEKRFGRTRIYRFKEENFRARAIKNLVLLLK